MRTPEENKERAEVIRARMCVLTEELNQLLMGGLIMTGIGQSQLMAARSEQPELSKIGTIIFVCSCAMSDADQKSFSQYAMAFLQDISSGNGCKVERRVSRDEYGLTEPGGGS